MTKTSRNFMLFIAVFFFLFVPLTSVNAACDYARQVELATEASNVNVTYEVKEIATGNQIPSDLGEGMIDETYFGVEINIYNLTEDLYIVVTNSRDGDEQTYYYDDTDNGTLQILRGNDGLTDIVTYTISVRSNVMECSGDEYRIIEIITPKYNYFSAEPQCVGSDAYYCEEYITQELNMDFDDFVIQAAKDQQNEPEIDEDPLDESNNHIWLYVTIVGAVIIIGVVATVIVRQIRRSSVK